MTKTKKVTTKRKSYKARHFVNCLVPVSHRFRTLRAGVVNKYDLVHTIARKHHRGSVNGGGCGFRSNDYDIGVSMPVEKIKAFTTDLKKHGVRFKDYGPEKA